MLALSNKWADVLRAQRETGMGYQIATISLADGQWFDRVVILGGYITQVGESEAIPFQDSYIVSIVVDWFADRPNWSHPGEK